MSPKRHFWQYSSCKHMRWRCFSSRFALRVVHIVGVHTDMQRNRHGMVCRLAGVGESGAWQAPPDHGYGLIQAYCAGAAIVA